MDSGFENPDLAFTPGSDPVPGVPYTDIEPNDVVIDVRSPSEYEVDHLPEAINVPLLDDMERSHVGILYRTEGPLSASNWALSQLRSRFKWFLEQLLSKTPPQSRLLICCARGGDRSRHVVQFLIENGRSSYQVVGGYWAYRVWVRQKLDETNYPNLWVLDGLTGTGKTRLLHAISKTRPGSVIDLEAFAQHRSSILGDVGLNPCSQKSFESSLAQHGHCFPSESWYLVEAESRKVGNREIPTYFWDQMVPSPRIQLESDIDTRARILVEEYRTSEGWEPLIKKLDDFARFSDLSKEDISDLVKDLRNDQPESVVKYLLEHHYDSRYQHHMKIDRVKLKLIVQEPEDLAEQVIQFLDSASTAHTL